MRGQDKAKAWFSPHLAGFFSAGARGGTHKGSDRQTVPPLRQFGCARKASALRADGQGVRQKLALLLLIPGLVLASAAAGPDPLIRKHVSEARFTLVATDQNNRPLPSLNPAEIVVLEDGEPVSHFDLRSAGDLPLRIGVVLDLSDSTLKSWALVRDSLLRSLQKVMRPEDTLLVVTFNSKVQTEQTLHAPNELIAALQDPPTGGLTALYDALYRESDHPLFVGEQEPHRSALILFSDGEDDLSLHGAREVISRAQKNGIAIYTVASHDPRQQSAGDLVLREFAESTGGRDFVVKDGLQLQEALSAINGELRSSYLLYYRVTEPSGPGAFRRVRIISTQNPDFRIRSRKGYFPSP